MCERIGEDGYKLLVGIGRDVGCVQHSACDGRPPYLMAVGESSNSHHAFKEFAIGGTLTPIPWGYCLPIEIVEKIACEFLETGKRRLASEA